MYADFMYLIKRTGSSMFLTKPYIYVIRPNDEEDEDEAWEGAISGIRKQIDKF